MARWVAALVAALLLAAAVAPTARATPGDVPAVNVTVAPGPYTVGDPIQVRVDVQYPEGTSVTPPSPGSSIGPFDLLDQPRTSRVPTGDGFEVLTYEFTVAAYRTGPQTLPPIEFIYTQTGFPTRTVVSEPVPITIESVLPPNNPPRDIQGLPPQADLPVPGAPVLLAAGGAGMAALLLAGAGFVVYRRLRARPRVAGEPVPVLEPEDAAVAELDRVAGLGLIEQGDFKTLYLLVADCVRRYLTDRYGFPAVALTTTELRGRMQTEGVGRWQARLVDGLLTECDAVVYAQYVPAPARARGDLSIAYEIVEMTRPRGEPFEEAAG